MTATERLRKLLDERGVEYQEETAAYGTLFTVFISKEEYYFVLVRENGGGIEIWSQYLTPEQAIAATLGHSLNNQSMSESLSERGTCRIDYRYGEWYCTGCGKMVGTSDATSELYIDGNAVEMFSYCPNCGRRVRGDAE